MHWWSKEEIEYLREHYVSHNRQELLEMFNDHFNLAITPNQLKGALTRNSIRSGRSGHYEKGSTPVNKGKKFPGQINKTSFKKGDRSKNYKPVGTERVDCDGYVLIKVSDTGSWHERWRHKHKVIWEKENGPIPKGHCLLFLDSDKQNISLDNLQLITQAQLVRLNQNRLIFDNPEFTKTGIVIASIYNEIGKRKKKNEDKEC
ncbi:HNH endonuclease signature motif containing protein [Lysinibacillus sp. M3]|uniref:HNH endonuclease signature motif containing protein n=1 Tax=Lysinibacillus zambalensis TaxID=3160866 RepID=A0ABV1MUX8_9BACI